MRRTSIIIACCAAAIAACTASAAHASLLAYEGFDYTPGQILAGQNGGVGFGVNTWVFVNSGLPTAPTVVSPASETFNGNAPSTANATGHAALVRSGDRRGRLLDTTRGGPFGQAGYLDANGNVGANGKTFYVSFTQRSGADLPDSFFEFEFNRDDLGDGGRVMGIGDDVPGNNVNLRTGAIADQSLSARNLATNLYIVKIDFLPGNDRVSVYRNPTGAFASATPTLSVVNADVSFDGISMGAFIGNQSVYTDEVRVGTTFADVITGKAAGTQRPSAPDQWRPGFHYAPPAGFMNDPNGLIYAGGTYHMFYQATPDSVSSGAKSWGHATSTDLVHWTNQPLAIAADAQKSAWSGSAVIDYGNTASFGAGAMIALYTGATTGNEDEQDQRLAYSTDGGRTFAKFGAVIPAAKTSGGANIPTRDPSVSWNPTVGRWVMAVSRNSGGGGSRPNGIEFYQSPDLKSWTYKSTYGSGGWECPDLFEVPLADDPATKKFVLMVGAGGGTDYHVGAFDGSMFTVEKVIHADYGPDFYAAQQYNDLGDDQDRDVVTAWMSNPGYANGIPAQTWRSEMTVPRKVELTRANGQYVMRQNPVAEIDALRRPIAVTTEATVAPDVDPLEGSAVRGDMLDLVARFAPGSADRFGLKVHVGLGQETVVGYDATTGRLYVDRTHSSSYTSMPLGLYSAPLALQSDGSILLRVLVDRSSVEVFANGGLLTMSTLSFAESYSDGVALFAEGGTANLLSFEAYRLDTSLPEPAISAFFTAVVAPTIIRRRRAAARGGPTN